MKLLILLSLIFSSCNVVNEGNITVNPKVTNIPAPSSEDVNTDNTSNNVNETDNNNSSQTNNETTSNLNQILETFEDSTTYANYFNLSYDDGTYFTANFGITNSLFNSKTIQCVTTLNSRKNGACIHTTQDTFNLPITVEFEFHAPDPYWTGGRIGFSIFQDYTSKTYDTYYGFVNSGTNALGMYWQDWYNNSLGIPYYSRYIEGFGSLSGIDQTHNISLGDQGKIKIDIDVLGNWELTYSKYDTNKNVTDTLVHNGLLSSLPTNFKIQIFQGSYSNTSRTDGGDTQSSSYTNYGQYTYIDNIKITY